MPSWQHRGQSFPSFFAVFFFCTTNLPTISSPLFFKLRLMRVKLKQSDLQLTRATACVGVSHAEARTTANGSSGVSKQPSHPPLVPFFSTALHAAYGRLLLPRAAISANILSLRLYFSVLNKQQECSFLFFFLQARRWTQVNLRLPAAAAAVVTFCPPPHPPLSHNNGGHCAVLHS